MLAAANLAALGAWMALSWQTAALLAVAGYVAAWVYQQLMWYGKPLPKGSHRPPRSFTLPLIGSPMVTVGALKRPHELAARELARTNGTTGWVIGGRLSTLTSNPANVEHILGRQFENYVKGRDFHDRVRDLLGDGIFAVDGDQWRRQRNTASQLFTRSFMGGHFLPVFKDQYQLLRERLARAAAADAAVDLQDVFYRYTLDCFCQIAFGVQLGSLERDDVPFARAFDDAQATIQMRFVVPSWRLLRRLRVGPERRMPAAIDVINEFAYGIIESRRREAESLAPVGGVCPVDPRERGGGGSRIDLLTHFLQMRDESGAPLLTAREVRDIILNFILAGRDTTALTLTWASLRLAQHPEVLAQLRAETACRPDAALTFESVEGLRYTHAVVGEVLRLHPPVPVDVKMAVRDDVLPDGTFVEAGSYVGYVPWAMGRRPSLWGEDALEFRPGRFLEPANAKLSPFKFTAFQAGPRICLGQHLAYLEASYVLAALSRDFDFALEPNQPLTYRVSITLPMKQGLRVRVTPRRTVRPDEPRSA